MNNVITETTRTRELYSGKRCTRKYIESVVRTTRFTLTEKVLQNEPYEIENIIRTKERVNDE